MSAKVFRFWTIPEMQFWWPRTEVEELVRLRLEGFWTQVAIAALLRRDQQDEGWRDAQQYYAWLVSRPIKDRP